MPSTSSVFALLDDSSPDHAGPSRLYTDFRREHRCIDPATLDTVWAAVEADQRAGLHAVLLADYEWGARLQQAGWDAQRTADAEASLRVLMFASLEALSSAAVADWLRAQEGGADEPGPAGAMDLQPSEDEAVFTAAIAAIQAAIRDGETYQVNHTFRLNGRAHGEPVALYRRLRARQPVGYGAFIALPPCPRQPEAATHLLSLSPELFLRHEAGTLTARPMKGTAPRHADPATDLATAQALRLDVKNRAENLMIVDLLRNDLGRIARVGSVRVPALFAVEPYATVYQMTSTVQAELLPGLGMPALLRATFPCGSITGAPKRHTMGLIHRLEGTARGLYCGAIGWVDAPPPGREGPGDCCLSVAIRTLVLGPPAAEDGSRPLRLGVGAGIVQDSQAAAEYAECLLKARFLTGLHPGFELFETLRAERDVRGLVGLPRKAAHLARLQRSARALGFALDAARAAELLEAALTALEGPGPWRVRLALAHDGALSCRHAALPALPGTPERPVGLLLAREPLPRQALSGHKTTLRAAYDAGVQSAEAQGAFDTLFWAEGDTLIEGGRSSLFVRLEGRWCTPPQADGALPGVLRAAALAGELPGLAAPVVERRLQRADLLRAEALAVGNALRGWLPAVLWSVPVPG